ncbi:hypothetical protein EBB56_00740 [Halomonas sp. YLB-10]|uniref:hypothetical protein n=1 Tax=Halomonas sp. YLB-10 TaxID=2483111 RepID=UPI000F600298|nr:hypothetical protein [Halomonas sp. YLB-10]RQW72537.1 hypothetical protein EBB56_00740 [Halomonas sp. YLB-10]
MDSLIKEINKLAESVGFSQVGSGHPLYPNLPENAYAYSSDYAWLVVWPVAETTDSALKLADQSAQNHFAESLPPQAGQTGSVIDAYVVLVLPDPPNPDMVEIRRARLKRSICRRAVVWYEEQSNSWNGLDSITVLGVRGLGPREGPRNLPNLPKDEKILLEKIGVDGKQAALCHLTEISQ